ncbi:hypothetical protein TGAMA5MH_05070 [Trichoderma gamsii]|uniref:Uncharacterized protein n=1 Tax=Trichoderma gamsii TaxID=398673 RepID=A0A2K0TCB1_9HYPO|nr:hypothetical protein TGAMA5MH_05070 [Trichoderma gamsii]
MASEIPPAYYADAAPPSYEEVLKKIESLVGSDPTPHKYIEAADKLTAEELSVVEANSDSIPPVREEDQERLVSGANQTLSEDDYSQELVREMARKAIEGATAIRLVFSQLDRKIKEIDLIHQSEFAPILERHRQKFESLLEIKFDDIIIKFLADESLTLERRKELIQDYIDEAADYESRADDIKKSFQSLQGDMNTLVADFSTWAKQKEGDLEDEIQGLLDDIDELIKKIGRIEKALIGLGVSASIVGALLLMSGPLGPFALIGGLIFIGASAAAIAGLAVELQKSKREIEKKNKEIADKEEQIRQIQAARLSLQELGEQQMEEFDENMLFIIGFWNVTKEDAFKAKEWLTKGGKRADMPEAMKENLEKGVKVYATMAIYLDMYAKGIRTIMAQRV